MAVKLLKRVASFSNKVRSKLVRKNKGKSIITSISAPVLISQSRSLVAVMIAGQDFIKKNISDSSTPAESPLVAEEQHTPTDNAAEASAEPQVESPTRVDVSSAVEVVCEGFRSCENKEETSAEEQEKEEKESSASDGEEPHSEHLFTSSDDGSDSDSTTSDSESSSSLPSSSPPSSPRLDPGSPFLAEAISHTPVPNPPVDHAARAARTMQRLRSNRPHMLLGEVDEQLKQRSLRSDYRRSTLSSTPAGFPRSPLPRGSYTNNTSRTPMRHASVLPSLSSPSRFGYDSSSPRLSPFPSSSVCPRLTTRTSPLSTTIDAVSEETEEEVEEHTPYNSAQDDRFIHLASLRSPRKEFGRREGMEMDREDLRKMMGKQGVRSKGVGAWEEEKRRVRS